MHADPEAPPPTLIDLFRKGVSTHLEGTLSAVPSGAVDGKYLHWDELIRRTPPAGLTHEDWWFGLKMRRTAQPKSVPLRDSTGRDFVFGQPDPIPERLHHLDLSAGGMIDAPPQITNAETRDRYLISSLIEEAITSSQLEGASATRDAAKTMLRSGRKPRNRSERMILNNYLTMRKIAELKSEKLSPDLIFELHRIVTDDTLDDPSGAGRFRRSNEKIRVERDDGTILHIPPPADELPRRLELMCTFANGEPSATFIHPAIRSIILHFWLGYDHPFIDGNGRTARALFYWSMLHRGFWLFEFISISHVLLQAPNQYSRSFLYTETDENDLTYFVLHQLEVIERALTVLKDYIARKVREVQDFESQLRTSLDFNYRQKALLSHALKHRNHEYTIESHQRSHNVVHQTARTDLLALVQLGILEARKNGRKWFFRPVKDLARVLDGKRKE